MNNVQNRSPVLVVLLKVKLLLDVGQLLVHFLFIIHILSQLSGFVTRYFWQGRRLSGKEVASTLEGADEISVELKEP